MSPKILKQNDLLFWFHSYDALHEDRPSVHVGKGSQNDSRDAKIWLKPKIEVSRSGRTLREHELNRAIKVIEQNHDFILEEWYEFKGRGDPRKI